MLQKKQAFAEKMSLKSTRRDRLPLHYQTNYVMHINWRQIHVFTEIISSEV